ncbi:hypothetical protein [Enterococcus phage PEF1]
MVLRPYLGAGLSGHPRPSGTYFLDWKFFLEIWKVNTKSQHLIKTPPR